MTTITHICSGYLISQYAYSLGLVPQDSLSTVTIVSIIAANGPDFDVVAINKLLHHRASFLHTPFYWLIAFVLSGVLIYITKNDLASMYLFLIGVNVLLHFLMDSISVGHGIQWFAPFVKKEFGLIFGKPSENIQSFMKNFFKYPVVAGESLVWVATYLIKHGIWRL